MKRFLKEITSKENWKKAYHLNAIKDPIRSRRSEKIEWIPFSIAILIGVIMTAIIFVILMIIMHLINPG